MNSGFEEQIVALEREKSRLEAMLSADESWLTLQALSNADAGARAVLTKALAANPYFVAREKILEVIAILEHTTPAQVRSLGERGIASHIASLGVSRVAPGEPDSSDGLPAGHSAQSTLSVQRRFSTELTLIRGIDDALAIQLAALGVTRCKEVAAWTAQDVERVRSALGLGKRISKENWIEQAALLAPRMPEPAPAAAVAVPSQLPNEAKAPEAAAEIPLPDQNLAAFTRPPLFDFKPERITPPFVARTLPAESPAVPFAAAHAPAVRQAATAIAQDDEMLAFARAEAASAVDSLEQDEAEVVIVSSRPAPVRPQATPPPLPASLHSDVEIRRAAPSPGPAPARASMPAIRAREVDKTPYADDRGFAEEAAVEIIRPKRS